MGRIILRSVWDPRQWRKEKVGWAVPCTPCHLLMQCGQLPQVLAALTSLDWPRTWAKINPSFLLLSYFTTETEKVEHIMGSWSNWENLRHSVQLEWQKHCEFLHSGFVQCCAFYLLTHFYCVWTREFVNSESTRKEKKYGVWPSGKALLLRQVNVCLKNSWLLPRKNLAYNRV